MKTFLQEKLPQVKDIFKHHKVKSASVFGSVCTEKFNAESDIDFIVRFEDGLDPVEYSNHYFTIISELEKLFQRSVDIVAEETIKNPYFIKVVNKTRTSVYEG
jgi:predicted nucleotidyltransferase